MGVFNEKLIAVIFVLANISSFATGLSAGEASKVLTEIDNICGDTWCEGDFNFSFDDIKCDFEKKTCQLDFQYIWYEWDETYEEPTQTIFVDHSCQLEGISGYSDMIEKRSNGWDDLVREFYEKVSDCITAGEEAAYAEVEDNI